MKTRLLFGLLLMMLGGSMALVSSCSKDDDDNEGDNKGSIYGCWQRQDDTSKPNEHYYFRFTEDGKYTRLIIEEDEDGNIIKKKVDEQDMTVSGNRIFMGSFVFTYSVNNNWLKLNMIDPDDNDNVVLTAKMSKIPESQFNTLMNAKVIDPLSIHKQWLTTEVGTVDPAFAGIFSGLILDLTDETTGYMLLSPANDIMTYKKGHWYVARKENYWVKQSTSTTGKVGFGTIEYEYKLSKTDLELTLVSKGLTAHYTAVVDIVDDGPIDL